jgi:hypothetical protein
MNARVGFAISTHCEKKQADLSSAVDGCRLVAARAELSNLPHGICVGRGGLPARRKSIVPGL